jgi:hypothetical protein
MITRGRNISSLDPARNEINSEDQELPDKPIAHNALVAYGTFEASGDVRFPVALGDKAEVMRTWPKRRNGLSGCNDDHQNRDTRRTPGAISAVLEVGSDTLSLGQFVDLSHAGHDGDVLRFRQGPLASPGALKLFWLEPAPIPDFDLDPQLTLITGAIEP